MTTQKPLRADALRNREQVLRAARESFAAEGSSVPLDVIARRAGVGPGTVYRHFPTKEALYEAVVLDRFRLLADRAGSLADAADPGTALLGFIQDLVKEAAPKKDLIDALDRAGIPLGPGLVQAATDLRAAVGRLLGLAQQAGAVRADIGTEDVMLLVSGIILAVQRHDDVHPDPGRALAVVCDGLRAPRPSPG
jgi:AcrR family transcriptional regulator